MVESVSHLFLKKVGKLFLYNQLCHMVEAEIKMNQLGLLRHSELDNKKVIDVVGVGLKYFRNRKRRLQQEEYDEFQIHDPNKYEWGYNVLRGIEVKISRNDFKNGFICTSSNYNYVLTPMKLVSPSLLPKGVGLIEFNKYKFNCELENYEKPERRPFKITGLRVVRKASYRNIPQFHIDHVITEIALRNQKPRETVLQEVLTSIHDPELVYQNQT